MHWQKAWESKGGEGARWDLLTCGTGETPEELATRLSN